MLMVTFLYETHWGSSVVVPVSWWCTGRRQVEFLQPLTHEWAPWWESGSGSHGQLMAVNWVSCVQCESMQAPLRHAVAESPVKHRPPTRVRDKMDKQYIVLRNVCCNQGIFKCRCSEQARLEPQLSYLYGVGTAADSVSPYWLCHLGSLWEQIFVLLQHWKINTPRDI